MKMAKWENEMAFGFYLQRNCHFIAILAKWHMVCQFPYSHLAYGNGSLFVQNSAI
jgi:hypothetical protein